MEKDAKIPSNYQTVMPYLIIKDAAKFLDFTQKVFDAIVTQDVKRDNQTIMHAEVRIGESTIMLADASEEFSTQAAGLFVYVDNADERFKKAIEEGAKAINAVTDQSYGRSGGVLDPFGNSWWITSLK